MPPRVKIQGGITGSVKKAREQSKGSGPVRMIPKEGDLTVRFLTEPDQWFGYKEHYRKGDQPGYFACTEGNCSGCDNGDDVSFKYLANAVDRDSDRVIALKFGKDVANRLIMKYDKYETLLDRDYSLSRDGEGFNTMYDVAAEPPTNFKSARYKQHDLTKLVEDQWKAYHDIEVDEEDEDEDDEGFEEEKPVHRKRRSVTSSNSSAIRRKPPVKKSSTTRRIAKPPGRRRRSS